MCILLNTEFRKRNLRNCVCGKRAELSLCLCVHLYGQLLVPLAFLSNGTVSTFIFHVVLCNLCSVN